MSFLKKRDDDHENIAFTIKELIESGNYSVVQGVFNSRTNQVEQQKNANQVAPPVINKTTEESLPDRKERPSVQGFRLFISYSRTDSQFVDHLENDLKIRGYTCWVDRSDLTGGQNWVTMIQKAIDSCQAMVVVLSPESANSIWVQREFLYALEMKKLVVPLIWRPGFQKPLALIERQVIDCSVNYVVGLTSLVKALSSQ